MTLSELADQIFGACEVSLEGLGHAASIAVVVPQQGRPEWTLPLLRNPAEKWAYFDLLAERAEQEQPSMIAFGGEAWVMEIAREKMRWTTPDERRELLSRGTTWLAENGFGTRREVISITAQNIDQAYFLDVPFRRRERGVIQWLTPVRRTIFQTELDAETNALKFYRQVAFTGKHTGIEASHGNAAR